MPAFRNALDRLAALAVPGIAHSYGLDDLPDMLARPQLPALLVLPGQLQESRLFGERGEGFRTIAFSGGPRTVTVAVTHLLLVAPDQSGAGLRSHLPRLVDLIDAYLAQLALDVTLNGALVEPARVRVEPSTYTHGGIRYHGCAFRHLWLIEI